jgi:hypothetical protein
MLLVAFASILFFATIVTLAWPLAVRIAEDLVERIATSVMLSDSGTR